MSPKTLEDFVKSIQPLFEDLMNHFSVNLGVLDISNAEPYSVFRVYYSIVGDEDIDLLVNSQYADNKIICTFSDRVLEFDEQNVNLMFTEPGVTYERATLINKEGLIYEFSSPIQQVPYAVVLYNLKVKSSTFSGLAKWLPGSALLDELEATWYEEWVRRIKACYELLTSSDYYSVETFKKYLAVLSGVPISYENGVIQEVVADGNDAIVKFASGNQQVVKGYGGKLDKFKQGYVGLYEPLTNELEVVL